MDLSVANERIDDDTIARLSEVDSDYGLDIEGEDVCESYEDDLVDESMSSDMGDFDIHAIKEGARLVSGAVVTAVYAKGSDFVIYSLDNDSFPSWKWSCNSLAVDDGLHKLSLLLSAANKKFKGTPFRERDELVLASLRVIFQSRDEARIEKALLGFEEAIKSQTEVKAVIAHTSKFTVWITGEDNVGYKYRGLDDVQESVKEFTRIKYLAAAMLPKESVAIFNRRLGAALANAFRTRSGADIGDIFGPLEGLIHKIAENKLRVSYLLTTTYATAIFVLLFFVLYVSALLPTFLNLSLIVACGGFLGTFISVLERSSEIRVSEYESPSLIVLQGLLRVCLGGVFGFTAYLAAVSGFAFSIFSDAVAKLLLLGIVAGFSERLIPDLIHGISSGKEKDV